MKETKTQKLTILAILTALTIVLGMVVKIPTLTGFLTLLDAGIFFTAFYFGKKEGAIVGGLSGFLIDLIAGYPQWMLISLFAHGAQGYFAGFTGKWRYLGLALSSVIMVGTYFVASIVLYNLGDALAGVTGNIFQNFVGMAVGYILAQAVKKVAK